MKMRRGNGLKEVLYKKKKDNKRKTIINCVYDNMTWNVPIYKKRNVAIWYVKIFTDFELKNLSACN